jgi:hypothetical protein
MTDRIVLIRTEKEGTALCVRSVMASYSEPVANILFWPIATGSSARMFWRDNKPNSGPWFAEDGRDGLYSWERAGTVPGMYDRFRSVRLIDGGSTQPIAAIAGREIPAPKVRKGTQVRYQDGRWQKYLKTKGWITA